MDGQEGLRKCVKKVMLLDMVACVKSLSAKAKKEVVGVAKEGLHRGVMALESYMIPKVKCFQGQISALQGGVLKRHSGDCYFKR